MDFTKFRLPCSSLFYKEELLTSWKTDRQTETHVTQPEIRELPIGILSVFPDFPDLEDQKRRYKKSLGDFHSCVISPHSFNSISHLNNLLACGLDITTGMLRYISFFYQGLYLEHFQVFSMSLCSCAIFYLLL